MKLCQTKTVPVRITPIFGERDWLDRAGLVRIEVDGVDECYYEISQRRNEMPPIDWMRFLQILIESLNECLNPDATVEEAQAWVRQYPLRGQRVVNRSLKRCDCHSPENCAQAMRVIRNCDCDTLTRLATGELKVPPPEL